MIHFLLGCLVGAIVAIGMVAAWAEGYAAGRNARDEERRRA